MSLVTRRVLCPACVLQGRASLTANLAQSLRCAEPTCYLRFRISAGSARVVVFVIIPDASPVGGATAATSPVALAAANATRTAVMASIADITTATPSDLGARLNLPVLSISRSTRTASTSLPVSVPSPIPLEGPCAVNPRTMEVDVQLQLFSKLFQMDCLANPYMGWCYHLLNECDYNLLPPGSVRPTPQPPPL